MNRRLNCFTYLKTRFDVMGCGGPDPYWAARPTYKICHVLVLTAGVAELTTRPPTYFFFNIIWIYMGWRGWWPATLLLFKPSFICAPKDGQERARKTRQWNLEQCAGGGRNHDLSHFSRGARFSLCPIGASFIWIQRSLKIYNGSKM